MRLKAAYPSRTRLTVARRWALAGALLLAVAATGCTSGPDGSTLSRLPESMGGLPADTPSRPVTQAAYPAVHDMPPPRPNATLTQEQIKAAEAEMTAASMKAKKQADAPIDGK